MYHHLRSLPHTTSGPSPVFVVCGCLDEAEGGRPAVRPLHMFPIPPCRPSLSSFGLLLPSHLSSSPLLSVCLPCPPNRPLDSLFVCMCRPVAWQQAETILQSTPITPWETTSNILHCTAARSQWSPPHTQTHTHLEEAVFGDTCFCLIHYCTQTEKHPVG